jgi:hypothetical protein
MNCVNHPDVPVAAYCQNCGKALCSNCVRSVAGVIYCEPCLAARLGIGGAAVGAAGAAQTGYPGVIAPGGPNPGTAFALGFIPGVGAMYNGQFVKGMVHVLVFVVLIGITNQNGVFGVFIAAWIAYQIIDAYQTAKARRDGLPLPNPFGLNDLGAKMGIPASGPVTGTGAAHGFTATQVPPMPPPPGAGYPPAAGFTGSPYSNVPPVPPPPGMAPPGFDPAMAMPPRRHEPIGAIILIGLGVLFLLNSLDVFHFNWFGRLWPLLIIAFGALLFFRRTREIPPPPPPTSGGPQ